MSAASANAPAEPDESGLHGARGALATACVLAALSLVVHSAAVTNVALPALADALHVSSAGSVRVVTAYQLALVMALLPSAALGERLGYRRVFSAGIALFTAASLACALAPTLPWLLAARFLQGLGGAAVMALALALLRFVVPAEKVARAIGWNALTVALSTAAAPTVGALLLSVASLPWLFASSVPLGVLVLVATRALPEVAGSERDLDAKSVGLNALVFASFIAASELASVALLLTCAALVLSGLALIALIRRELPKLAPLVPLDLLRARSFRVSVIASISCFAGQTAALIALPFYLQQGSLDDAMTIGLMITPWPLGAALAAPVAGRLAERVSTAQLCAVGGALLALGLVALAGLPLQSPPFALVPFVVLCGAGFGLFQVPNNRNMLLAAPRARSGAAGGMQGSARLIGQTLGAVMMSLLFAHAPAQAAPRIAFASAALLSLVAGLVSVSRGTPHAQGRRGILRRCRREPPFEQCPGKNSSAPSPSSP